VERLRVGVIFGGRSVEHDVSIVTAHQAMAQLADAHEVIPIYVTREGRWLTSPALNDLEVYKQDRASQVGESCVLPAGSGERGLMVPGGRLRGGRTIPLDVVIPAIHGTNGEDGTLQGTLELAQIPYVGSGVVGSAVGFDKIAMKRAFDAVGLPTVPHVVVEAARLDSNASSVIDEVENEIGYPAFVKPARAGSSVGIERATDRASLERALDVARRYDLRILVERSMEGCLEINCAVLGGAGREPRVSVCEQPVAWEEFLTFSNKYIRGGKDSGGGAKQEGMAGQDRKIPAPISDALTKQIQDNAMKAFTTVDAGGVARVDAFLKEDTGETWVMEINTVPGSFAFYLWEASGVPFKELLDELVAIALETHRLRSELVVSFDSGMLQGGGGSKTDD
jgi:D-alanine-D-alanine ligase